VTDSDSSSDDDAAGIATLKRRRGSGEKPLAVGSDGDGEPMATKPGVSNGIGK
jgi:hypothetical protein